MAFIPNAQQVAEVLMLAPEGAPWAHEGLCRAMIRATFCLDGVAWSEADRRARRLVELGRGRARIRKPVGYDTNILPALDFAIAWRECPIDGRPFKPRHQDHVYCSFACKQRAWRIGAVVAAFARCANCGRPIEDPAPGLKYCSLKCRRVVHWSRAHERRRLDRAERRGVDTLARGCALEGCDNPIPAEAHLAVKFCSDACREKRKDEHNRLHREARRIARAKELGIDLEHRVCARDGCSTPIPVEADLGRRFCSRRCARMATYHEQADATDQEYAAAAAAINNLHIREGGLHGPTWTTA